MERNEDRSGGVWVNKGHIVMGLLSEIPLDDPSDRATWKLDRRMGVYHNATSEKASQVLSGSSKLKEFLARVENQPESGCGVGPHRPGFQLLVPPTGSPRASQPTYWVPDRLPRTVI
ncbi:hypothetical protein ACMFMG_005265 [Clarireedia jacksonii]